MKKTTHSRRGFLHRCALGGTFGGALATSTLSRLAYSSPLDPVKPLRAAVIGCGGIASHHARVNFGELFEIAAICDVDSQRLDAYRPLVSSAATTHSDYHELIDRKDLDVFFVCTPDHWHAKITVDALRSGKDVYCEKPLTFSVDEGRLINRVVKETGGVLQVGTQQRSDPKFQTAVALARSGRLGKIKRITVAIGGGPVGGPFFTTTPPKGLDWNQWLGQAPEVDYIPQRCHGNFRWWYEYSGGKLTDWGAHHVDIAIWALNETSSKPVSIEVLESVHPVDFADGYPTSSDCYNTANSFRLRCGFIGGTEMIIRDSAADLGFDNGILFECEGGKFFVNRSRLAGKPIEDLQTNAFSEDELRTLRGDRPVMTHMESFLRCCHERKRPLSDAESHIKHLDVCHLANIAMRLGSDLQWDATAGRVLGNPEANRWLARTQRKGFEVS